MFKPSKINAYLMFKLPAAFLCGVRLDTITSDSTIVHVKHRWINQNPFNSMYFAVQAMAAELTTGALVMAHIKNSNADISMLITSMNCEFFKKATGRVEFSCQDGALVGDAVQKMQSLGEHSIVMRSTGRNQNSEIVAEFEFRWSLRLRK